MVIKQADKSWRWGPSRATTTTTTTLSRATTNNFTTLGERQHKNKFLIYIKKLLGKRIQEKKTKYKKWNQNKNRKAGKSKERRSALPPLPATPHATTNINSNNYICIFIYLLLLLYNLFVQHNHQPPTHAPTRGKDRASEKYATAKWLLLFDGLVKSTRETKQKNRKENLYVCKF